jgi:hypothetical protein
MSDFDAVLERLLTDPAFARALGADRAAALAGYQLTPDEIELLSAQVSTESGGEHTVETRNNKSSMFGLFEGLSGLAGGHGGFGPAGGGGGGAGATSGIGGALGATGSGSAGIGGSLHSAGLTEAGIQGLGPAQGGSGGGTGLSGVLDQFDPGAGHGHAGFGAADAQPIEPPAGYHTHVDADGDGRWDDYTLRGRPDGGVDIMVDLNHDGRPDFIGHDTNADGLVESADYDTNHDGVFETHMYDNNGDGWLDRTIVDGPPTPDDQGMGGPLGPVDDPGSGGAIGRNLRLPERP